MNIFFHADSVRCGRLLYSCWQWMEKGIFVRGLQVQLRLKCLSASMLLEKDQSQERTKHLSNDTEEGRFAHVTIYYAISSYFWVFKEKDIWSWKISGKTYINFALTEF